MFPRAEDQSRFEPPPSHTNDYLDAEGVGHDRLVRIAIPGIAESFITPLLTRAYDQLLLSCNIPVSQILHWLSCAKA